MDGIKCFDLEHLEGGDDDLRMSIDIENNHQIRTNKNEFIAVSDSLQLWQELEKVKRENEELHHYKQIVEKEKS